MAGCHEAHLDPISGGINRSSIGLIDQNR